MVFTKLKWIASSAYSTCNFENFISPQQIFDTCSKSKRGIYYPLYGPILISYGTPDRQVSQILANKQNTELLLALVWCQDCFFWSSFVSLQGLPPHLVVAWTCSHRLSAQSKYLFLESFFFDVLSSHSSLLPSFLQSLPPILLQRAFHSVSLVNHFKFVPISSLTLYIHFCSFCWNLPHLVLIHNFSHPFFPVSSLSPFL